MYKKDVLDYLSTSTKCKDKANSGAVSLLAEILDVSAAAVSRFGDIIPIKQAVVLDKKFRSPETLRWFGLKAKGRPKFDTALY